MGPAAARPTAAARTNHSSRSAMAPRPGIVCGFALGLVVLRTSRCILQRCVRPTPGTLLQLRMPPAMCWGQTCKEIPQ